MPTKSGRGTAYLDINMRKKNKNKRQRAYPGATRGQRPVGHVRPGGVRRTGRCDIPADSAESRPRRAGREKAPSGRAECDAAVRPPLRCVRLARGDKCQRCQAIVVKPKAHRAACRERASWKAESECQRKKVPCRDGPKVSGVPALHARSASGPITPPGCVK